ncbi:MAG: adenylate kinase [Candidatus Hydrogenedentes bacterium]|nr:adenylate kinase [Candidatus Hydrogenedentota bacterium]
MAVPKRILIVGATGSGKTTVARQLSARYDLPHVELDVLYWGPGWTELEGFDENAGKLVAGDRWIVEGGYESIMPTAWSRADRVVWLDYPFPIVLWQLVTRILIRMVTREVLFNGNRETAARHFFSRESLILWLFRTYRIRREKSLERMHTHPDVPVTHLRSRRETTAWLRSLD